MRVGSLFKFDLSGADSFHGILLSTLELLDFIEVQSFHLLPEGFHFVAIPTGFFDSDAADLELFQAPDFSLQVGRVPSLALLLVLHHALLQRLERSCPVHVLLL